MPNVGMENWTSDYDRICWNESNPRIKSPLFVPKHNWTEEDFEKARKEPAYQDEVSQWAIQREYERLNGIPHSYPQGTDPWKGSRGEAGPEFWGKNTLQDIPGESPEGLKADPRLRFTLQLVAHQVKTANMTFRATDLVTLMAALQELKVLDLGATAQERFPLREDEFKGPQFHSDEQRAEAVGVLVEGLTSFLGPAYPPTDVYQGPEDLQWPDDLWEPFQLWHPDTVDLPEPAAGGAAAETEKGKEEEVVREGEA